MNTENRFNSKSEATRYYIIESLKTLENERFMPKQELKAAVDSKLIEDSFGKATDANFSEALRVLLLAEDTPVLKNPLARGLYGYDHNKQMDLDSLRKMKAYSNQHKNNVQNKNGRFENRVVSILNETKKEIYKIIESEQVPLSVLIDSDQTALIKYQERVSSIKEAITGIDEIIESLNNKKND